MILGRVSVSTVTTVTICVLLALCSCAVVASDLPRICSESVPIHVSLTIDAVPLLNAEGTLTATVTAEMEQPDVTLEITMPEGGKVVGSPTIPLGRVPAYAPVVQTVKVKFATAGNKLIRAAVKSVLSDGQSWSSVAYLPLNVGSLVSVVGLGPETEPATKQMTPGTGTMIGPAPTSGLKAMSAGALPTLIAPLPGANAPAAKTAGDPQPAGTLILSGSWHFNDRNGVYTPMHQVYCELTHGSTGAVLTSVYTNWDGSYTFPAVTNPGAAGVRITCSTWTNYGDGNFISVIDAGGDQWNDRYIASTDAIQFGDGEQSAGGWMLLDTWANRKAWWIHDDFIKAYLVPRTPANNYDLTGRHVGRWSSTSTDGTYWNGDCHYAAGDADDTPDTILHEMGHSVMGNIYGGYWPPHDCPSPHYFTGASGVHCGWTEGWAHIWHAWTTNDGIRSYPGGGSWNFETATWDTAGWDDGDHVEGRVVGAVWDITDSANDGNDIYDGEWADVWDIMRNVHCDTFADFWAQWKSRGHPKHGAVASIYQCTIDYDTAPTLNALPNITTPEDTPVSNAINLDSYASDPESYDYELTYAITNNTNASAGVSIDSSGYVDVNPAANWHGYSDVTIRCSDGPKFSASRTFRVTVTAVNDAPVISGIPNKSLLEDHTWDNAINLESYASDVETPVASLIYTITNNTQPSCGVTIDANHYIDIHPAANWTGVSEVTVRVSDGSLTDTDVFTVTVSKVNDSPVFSPLLPDRYTNEDTPLDNTINLWNYVSDVETPDDELEFTIAANTDANCGVSIDSNHYIDINPVANWSGQSDVTIRVIDTGGAVAQDTFRITVYAINDPPTIAYLPDKLVARNSSISNAIDLSLYAGDLETPDAGLIYAITGDTDPNCGVSIDASNFVDIKPASGWTGFSDVTIRVTDGDGLSAEDTFRVICASFYNTIAEARRHEDGTWVAVRGKISTARFPTYYYIEEPNRTSGIRIAADNGYSPGYEMTIAGTLNTDYAEREIVPYYRQFTGEGMWLDPLGMPNRSMGGKSPDKFTPPVPEKATDLYNVGLLVRTTGEVIKHIGGGRFFMTDGSPTIDNATRVPCLYVYGVPSGYQPPVGSYVTVTGISGATTLDRESLRVLRPRDDSDIVINKLNAAYVYYDNTDDAKSFESLLDDNSIATDVISIKAVARVDWSKYHVILIGGDTGDWSTAANVDAVVGANLPVVAIGDGGARFLDAVTVPDLYLGWLHTWFGTGATAATVVGGDIYSYPYNLLYPPGQNIGIYGRVGSDYVALYDPDGVTDHLLRQYDNETHYVLASELDRFYQWGFYGSPDIMTTNGRNLFVNLIFSTAR